MRLPHLHYALAGTVALSLGLGFSFWQSAAEADRLRKANVTTSVALEAAQDEVNVLRNKLLQEARERRRAEASQMIAENGERTAREKLSLEIKARQAAEAGRTGAEANLTASLFKLGEAEQARVAAEQERDAVTAKLVAEQNERHAIESVRKDSATTAALISARLTREIQALKSAEAALNAAHEDIRTLAALETGDELKLCRITPEMPLAVSKLSGTTTGRSEPVTTQQGKSSAESSTATDGTAPQDGLILSAERTSQPALSVQ